MTEQHYANGSIKTRSIDVARIRRKAPRIIGETQQRFADAIGVSVLTLRNWEQGRRRPTGPALILLALIERDPMIVLNAKIIEPVA